MKQSFTLLAFALLTTSVYSSETFPEPVLAEKGDLVFESDFSKEGKVDKAEWAPRQATQWKIEDGVLRGRESTKENQAKKPHHKGLEPRVSAPITPEEFVMQFSVRFAEGGVTPIVPFVEFGHHIVRARMNAKEGMSLLVDYESLKVGEATDFKYEPGKWMHALAELKGDEFVIQFQGGPTLYAKHSVLSRPAPSGGAGFGLAGPRGGLAEIDNVKIWKAGEVQSTWEKRRADLPKFEAVQVREKPKK